MPSLGTLQHVIIDHRTACKILLRLHREMRRSNPWQYIHFTPQSAPQITGQHDCNQEAPNEVPGKRLKEKWKMGQRTSILSVVRMSEHLFSLELKNTEELLPRGSHEGEKNDKQSTSLIIVMILYQNYTNF
jgi:hypothetical protein